MDIISNEDLYVNDIDILVLDFKSLVINIFEKGGVEQVSEFTGVDLNSITCAIADNLDRKKDDEVYVINGYTFIRVKDFMPNPILAKIGKDNKAVDLSVALYKHYANKNLNIAEITEVLDIHEGTINNFYNLELALDWYECSFYDILKLPLIANTTVIDVVEYVFPLVNEKRIFKLVDHPLDWTIYSELAVCNDQQTVVFDALVNQEEKELTEQFEKDYKSIPVKVSKKIK